MKYFDECGMTSTHRRNSDIIQRCSTDVGTTVERVKVETQSSSHSASSFELAVVNCVCTAEEGFRVETYCTVYHRFVCYVYALKEDTVEDTIKLDSDGARLRDQLRNPIYRH